LSAICICVIEFVWLRCCCFDFRLDEIIVFRQLTKGEVKQIADIMLGEVFKRAEEKEIKIDVTERFKVTLLGYKVLLCMYDWLLFCSAIALFAASTVCFEQGRLCISWALL